MIIIRSKKAGFRRCGIAHPKEETQYPDDRFSKEELAILQAEPMLTVELAELGTEPRRIGDRAPWGSVPNSANPPEADEPGKESVKTGKKGKR